MALFEPKASDMTREEAIERFNSLSVFINICITLASQQMVIVIAMI